MDFCGARRAERERERASSSKKEIYIYPPPIKQTRPRLAPSFYAPPPLSTTKKEAFFLDHEFCSKKQKKKQKRWWTCNNHFTFPRTHARTRVNMSSAVSDSARVVRLFCLVSLLARAASTREGSFCGRRILCNVFPDDPPGWILSLSMGLSPSSSSAIRSRPDMS